MWYTTMPQSTGMSCGAFPDAFDSSCARCICSNVSGAWKPRVTTLVKPSDTRSPISSVVFASPSGSRAIWARPRDASSADSV